MTILEERFIKSGRAILLAVMRRPEFLLAAKTHIKITDFKQGTDRDCWIKINALANTGKNYDLYNVCNPEYADTLPAEVISKWEFDDFFYDCDLSFFEDRVIDYINLVDRERSAKGLQELLTKTVDGVLKTSQEIGESINSLSQKVYKLHPVITGGYAGEHIYDDIKEMSLSGKDGVKFGIKSVDEGLGTMGKGQFILLAARPGTGKSSLFLYPLYEHCRLGKHVCLLTMEMTRAEMMIRVVANRSKVSLDRIQGKAPATSQDGEAIAKAISELQSWKLTVTEQGINSPAAIDSFLSKSAAEKNPVEMLIIDHFGYLMPDSGKVFNRYNDYTLISNELKRLAKKHKCLIFCLTQLNRIPDYEKPTKANMRDTGSLEQDADKIIAMWRDAGDPKVVNVGAIKNRQGTEFETRLNFYGSTMQFFDS